MDNNIKKTKIPQGYKQTPIGVIPEDWKVKELGDLCRDICGEYGANKSAIPYSSDLPRYVRITDINDEGNLHFDSKASADLSLEEEKKFKLEHHDLLFARTGATVGKSYLHKNEIDKKFVYAGFLIRFRLCPNKVNPIFIRGYTNTSKYWHWVKTYSARSGQPGLNSNEYKSLKLPIPPLPEQKAIADCLSTWDKGIENLSALIASKKEQKKGLMQGLFSGELKVENGELVKVEDEKLWLKEWKEVRLEQVAKVVMGVSPSSKNYNDEKEGMLLIQGNADIKNRVSSPRQYTSEITKECNIGDILMSVRAPVGEISKSIHNACIGRGICAIQSNKNAESNFLYYYLVYTESLWSRLKQGSTFESVNTTDIKDFKLTIPTITEQTTISNVLTIADKEIEILEKKLETFKTQKKGLMQVLLTGEKRLV